MSRIVIGVCGKARSGKDTFADYVVAKYGFVRVALADELKRTLARWYAFSPEQLWGELKEQPDLRYPYGDGSYLTPRKAAQVLGTEAGRQIYHNTWVLYFERVRRALFAGTHTYDLHRGLVPVPWWKKPFHKPPAGIVVPDLRFENEVINLSSQVNSYVVKVHRPGALGLVGINGHASETEMDRLQESLFDWTIENNSSLEDYYTIIDTILTKDLPVNLRPVPRKGFVRAA